MEFSAKLRKLIKDLGWSVPQTSKRLGVRSHTTLHRWMSGESGPTLKDVQNIAKAAEVPVSYLADDSMDSPSQAAALSSDERKLIEIARRLGVERAGLVLEWSEELGFRQAAERLLSKEPPVGPAAGEPGA